MTEFSKEERAKYLANLPKKRMGAGALIFNQEGELLLVKPSYKNHWSIPGGVVEKDESPKNACLREIEEEIGIKLSSLKFLCVDYIKTNSEKDENLQFIFYGGVLDTSQIKDMRLDKKEISEYCFADTTKAPNLLGSQTRSLVKRLPKCLEVIKNKSPIYLEDGE